MLLGTLLKKLNIRELKHKPLLQKYELKTAYTSVMAFHSPRLIFLIALYYNCSNSFKNWNYSFNFTSETLILLQQRSQERQANYALYCCINIINIVVRPSLLVFLSSHFVDAH